MLRQIIYEYWPLIFPLVALAVAASICLAAAIPAARMNPARTSRPAGSRKD